MAGKREAAMQAAIAALEAAGFVAAGETPTQLVRIPTRENPLYGAAGGEPARLGGRLRFSKPGTNWRATVGQRTTFVYRVEGSTVAEGMPFDTAQTEAITAALAALS